MAQTFNVLQSDYSDVQWIEPTNGQAIDGLVAEIGNYSTRLEGGVAPDTVLRVQQELQVLCAHRRAFRSQSMEYTDRIKARYSTGDIVVCRPADDHQKL